MWTSLADCDMRDAVGMVPAERGSLLQVQEYSTRFMYLGQWHNEGNDIPCDILVDFQRFVLEVHVCVLDAG